MYKTTAHFTDTALKRPFCSYAVYLGNSFFSFSFAAQMHRNAENANKMLSSLSVVVFTLFRLAAMVINLTNKKKKHWCDACVEEQKVKKTTTCIERKKKNWTPARVDLHNRFVLPAILYIINTHTRRDRAKELYRYATFWP